MDDWDGAHTLFMSSRLIRELGSLVVLNSLRCLFEVCSKGGIGMGEPAIVTVAGLNLAEHDSARLRM
jgi:hypothetical protein